MSVSLEAMKPTNSAMKEVMNKIYEFLLSIDRK